MHRCQKKRKAEKDTHLDHQRPVHFFLSRSQLPENSVFSPAVYGVGHFLQGKNRRPADNKHKSQIQGNKDRHRAGADAVVINAGSGTDLNHALMFLSAAGLCICQTGIYLFFKSAVIHPGIKIPVIIFRRIV